MVCLFGTSAGWPARSLATDATIVSMATAHRERSRLVAAVQGGSYIGFAAWLFTRPRQYRETHGIETNDWVLRAHGTWMLVTGSALLVAAARGTTTQPEVRLLGVASAVGLATNDGIGAMRREVASIYYSDLAWESAIAALWALTGVQQR